jgi:hypothetical protein
MFILFCISGHSPLYTLGHSPIIVNEVKKALINYPYPDKARDFNTGT